jgi:Leucine-rich repeat (LRR) protein
MKYRIIYQNKSDLENVINDEKNKLYIVINNKKFIDEAINELVILNKIRIGFFAYDIGLENIPENLFNITNIEILNLSNNNISYIPISICKLKNLKELYLNENNFLIFPENICMLEQLQELILINCKINNIHNIKKLINLKVLFIGDNPLCSINSEICKLKFGNFRFDKMSA